MMGRRSEGGTHPPTSVTPKEMPMRTQYAIALAVIAGFGLGAASIHTLHAHAKEYVPKAQALIKKHGGKFLAASNNVVAFEGAPAKRIAIQQWESMEKVKAWQNSAELKDNRKIGNKYAKFRILAVEGMPQ